MHARLEAESQQMWIRPDDERTGSKSLSLTLAFSCLAIVAVVFGLWLLAEWVYFGRFENATVQLLHLARGISASLLLCAWAAWIVSRDRKQHEAFLRRSRDRYREFLNSTPGPVILFNENYRVVEWNDAAHRLYGITTQEAIGQHLPTIPPERWSELEEMAASAQRGVAVIGVESQRRNVLGERIDVSVSLSCLCDPETGDALFLEVTEDIRLRIELRRKMLEVEKLMSMGRMAAGIAHHLNTPLAAMRLRIGLLKKKVSDPQVLAELERLQAKVGFCEKFVQDVLQFARRSDAVRRPEDICEQICSIVAFLQPTLQMKGARVELNLSTASGARVLADRSHLEALFSILLMNAADALSGSGVIRIFASAPHASEVEVRIEDTGCGIDPRHLPHIFEPFFTTKESGRGTGLGMASAHSIVRDHGGSIEVRSQAQTGTTVTVKFPRLVFRKGGVEVHPKNPAAGSDIDQRAAA